MSQLIAVWLCLELLGAVGWCAGRRAFAQFPDRGFAWSKPLGILLVGATHWLLTAFGLLANDPGGSWLALALVGTLSARGLLEGRTVAAAGSDLRRWLRRRWTALAIEEGLFLLAFCAWALVRFADPAVAHTEQPMDLMFLTSVSESVTYPPGDGWLAGEPISYYYLGYWLVALLGKLSTMPTESLYNVAQAAWWALLVSGSFGLGFHGTRLLPGVRRARRALFGGLLAAAGTAFAGNLHFVAELLRRNAAAAERFGDWWWWRASRVVTDHDLDGVPIEVITEFPFFSYLLGDDHPHLLAMPFLLLVAALSLATATFRPVPSAPSSTSRWRAPRWNLAAAALGTIAAALLVPMNSWDFPAGAALVLGGCFLARDPAAGRGATLLRTGAAAAALAIATFGLSLPFLLTAQSQVRGLRPNLLHPTAVSETVVMFGLFLPGALALLLRSSPGGRARRRPVVLLFSGLALLTASLLLLGRFWATTSTAGAAWLASSGEAARVLAEAGSRWLRSGWTAVFWVAWIALALAQLGTRQHRARPGARSWLVLVTALAGGLALVPELVYVEDLFGSRMNTVFKFWYQAWPLLALASAVGIASGLLERRWLRLGAATGLVLLALAALFPAFALGAKIAPRRGTFDGLADLERLEPGLVAAARWLRESAPADARILEAPGESYHVDQSLVGAASGRATLLGWVGHEQQWRGDAFVRLTEGRAQTAESIFLAADGNALEAALETWKIEYVVLGPRERERYGARDAFAERRLRAALLTVFEEGGVTILRRRR